MNRGVLQSSPVQQMVAGNPNWWSLNSMRPPPPPLPPAPGHHHHHQQMINPPFLPPNSSFFPYASSPSWHMNELPADHTWSQLLMGGLVGEEDQIRGSQFQEKKLVNWEEEDEQNQAIQLMVDVKQELNYQVQQYVHANNEDNNHFHQTISNWSASSPKSSCTSSTVTCNNMLDFSSKMSDNGKRNPPPDRSSSECNSPAATGVNKKARVQSTSSQSTIKVRKEKLGDRITALHQLVSPFGKTDTASVLLEAIGYIRFLQSQIEALSLPYLATASSGNCSRQRQQHNESQEEPKKDLRSRGLCLVPVSCTLQVGSDNGADFWAPAIGGGFQ